MTINFFCVYFDSLTFVFSVQWAISHCFPWGPLTQMAGYNVEFRSRLIVDGSAFFFAQHESVGRSLIFVVSAYRWRDTVDQSVEKSQPQ